MNHIYHKYLDPTFTPIMGLSVMQSNKCVFLLANKADLDLSTPEEKSHQDLQLFKE